MFNSLPATLEAAPTNGNTTEIVDISVEQVKSIGESVLLNCTVNNPEKKYVIWEKKHPDYGMTLSTNRSLTINDPRIGLNVTESPETYILKVNIFDDHWPIGDDPNVYVGFF